MKVNKYPISEYDDLDWPHHVYCSECGAKVTSVRNAEDGEQEAIVKWNKRV